MYDCPNCGGDLRFDIDSQKLNCRYCSAMYEPEAIEKAEDAKEHNFSADSYQVTVFTCPECGAEIESTNLTAAGFCSYCGGATVLSARVQHEKKPAKIIPFQINKEDCKKSFAKLTRKMPYAPKEYRDPELLDRFMGYYLPYWTYRAGYDELVNLTAKSDYTKGSYHYTDSYLVRGQLDANYDGLSFDASGSFDDEISQRIAPFDKKQMIPFQPSYMLGFYADTADVDSELYEREVREFLTNDVKDHLGQPKLRISGHSAKIDTKSANDISREMAKEMKSERTMLPVWFLTYRNKDRLSYSVVNGQSGKIYADVPVQIRNFFVGSLLLAVVLFFLANAFVSLTGPGILKCSSFLAMLTAILYYCEIDRIEKRENRTDDKGYQSVFHREEKIEQPKKKSNFMEKIRRMKGTQWFFLLVGVWILILLFVPDSGVISDLFEGNLLSVLEAIIVFVIFIQLMRKQKNLKGIKLPEVFGTLFAVLVAWIILGLNPYQDLYYYGGSILAFLGIAVALVGMIRKYNTFATRPIPDFFVREGGDDRA